MDDKKHFIEKAIELACDGVSKGKGGPFGAVVVKDGKIIGSGSNHVTINNDPTAHAEILAIREACQFLEDFQLAGCEIYTSCEPCPMCFGAIYWARLDKVYYAIKKEDAASAGFDDDFIYHEINLEPEKRVIPFNQIMHEKARLPFDHWKNKEDKQEY